MKYFVLRLVVIIFIFFQSLAIVGCASTSNSNQSSGLHDLMDLKTINLPVDANSNEAPWEVHDAMHQSSSIDITPFHNSRDYWRGPTTEGAFFAGTYTRLLIKSTVKDSSSSDQKPDDRYKKLYDKRSLISRAIMGKDLSVVMTAKMRIANVLDISVPLAIVSHASNSDGENWTREVYFERRDFPLFLVKKNGEASTPSVTAEIKGSSSLTSRSVAAGIGALTRLASVAGASPALITTLNKDATKEASDKVDAEISKLLSSSITERSMWDRPLSNWVKTDGTSSRGGIEISFKLPSDDNWNDAKPMGSWTIDFAPPRPSIFSDWHICLSNKSQKTSVDGSQLAKTLRCGDNLVEVIKKVKDDVKPAEILNYKLLAGANNLGSIHSFVKSKDWYTTGVTALAKLNGQSPGVAPGLEASEFCRHVINEITALDLTQTDAELVLWALYKVGRTEFSVLDKNTDCKALMNESRPT